MQLTAKNERLSFSAVEKAEQSNKPGSAEILNKPVDPVEGTLVQTAIYGHNKVQLFSRGDLYHWKAYTNGKVVLRSVTDFTTKEKALKDISDCFR